MTKRSVNTCTLTLAEELHTRVGQFPVRVAALADDLGVAEWEVLDKLRVLSADHPNLCVRLGEVWFKFRAAHSPEVNRKSWRRFQREASRLWELQHGEPSVV